MRLSKKTISGSSVATLLAISVNGTSVLAEARGARVFDLPGLHGTAAEIDKQVHAEIKVIDEQIADAEAFVREIDAEMRTHRKSVLTKMDATAGEYGYVCKTLADTEALRDRTSNPARLADIERKINGFSRRKEKMEDDFVADDPECKVIQARRDAKMQDLLHLHVDMKKCVDWRREIGEAVRGTYELQGPLEVGSEGLIGAAKIEDVDRGVVTAVVDVFIPSAKEPGDKEGIVTYRGHKDEVELVISGLDPLRVFKGESLYLEKNVRIEKLEFSRHMEIAVAKADANDVETLVKAFDDFKLPTLMP